MSSVAITLNKLLEKQNLTFDESKQCMSEIMSGEVSEPLLAAWLVALRMKGEVADEIAGCAAIMGERATQIKCNATEVVDIVGTGGDGAHTINISTTAAIVTCGAGVVVPKHGNRSVSSKSGSADILSALGINIELSPEAMEACLEKVGMVFLFAPLLHPAMKYAMPVRKALQVRTVFNILGPLTNPARVKRYLLGVYTPELLPLIAEATKSLGVEHALIVHGAGGLDELSISGTSRYYEVKNGEITSGELNPEEFGLKIAPLEALKGGTPEENAKITRDILSGTIKGAKRDVVVLNAGAGIWMSGKADSLDAGIRLAEHSIDSGAAMNVLNELVEFTQHYKQ